MTPIVDGLESQYGDRITFQRLNVDEAEGRQAARRYHARGHPAMLLIDSEGEVVWSRVGVFSLDELSAALEDYLNP